MFSNVPGELDLAVVRRATYAAGVSFFALCAQPSQAQSICLSSPLGILECQPTTPTDPVTLPGQTQPVTVTLPDTYSGTGTIDIGSTGPIILDGTSTTTTLLDSQPALNLDSATDIIARVNLLQTSGAGSTGIVAQALDSVILLGDGVVTTVGDFADGLNIRAGSAQVSLDRVSTAGIESDGVEIVTLSGPAVLDANVIETLGSGSTDAIIRAAGDIDVNVGVLRTGGDQALGLDLQTDATACAILGAGSCDVTAVANSITTDGFGSIGALVVAAGDTDISVDALQTGGDEAAGLDLSADPTACVALGVGACDTAFTVQNLTTNGARSPGAVVRAVGDIDGSVGVLTTNGADAIGLDLASDPTACAILGAGSCETSFSVGQLTTNGDGAIGALVRAAGPTTANIGLLETRGDNAPGVDIAADPQACVLLGLGSCDTVLTAQTIKTLGEGSAGVLLDVPGRVTADLGRVETIGANAPAIVADADPQACVLLGAGGCSTGLTVDDVRTAGLNSIGIQVLSPGNAVIDFGSIVTQGGNSPALVANLDPAVCALIGSGACAVNVTGGPVDTGGPNSPGVVVTTPDDAVVDVGPVTTTGPNSPGIDVDTGTGDQSITTGGVTVTGPGSNGVDAVSTDCGDISITATGPVYSASGTAIRASTACRVTIVTQPGAPVAGGAAGIDATNGTGATIVIGDSLYSPTGPALNVDGGAATVTVLPTGSIVGRIDLTDNNDTLTNYGTIVPGAGTSFGGGNDRLVNAGTITVRGPITLGGLETLTNSGLIDMRDGDTADTLTIPGAYAGSGGAALGVDVAPGTASDRLIVGGAATGSTTVLVQQDNPGFVNGALIVDAGAGSSGNAFSIANPDAGLVQYVLQFDQAANNFLLYGVPGPGTAGLGLLADGARELFYAGSNAVRGHLSGARGGGSGDEGRIDRALWFNAYTREQSRDGLIAASPFGVATTYDLGSRQHVYGAQAGIDLFGSGATVFGLTAGYGQNKVRLKTGGLRMNVEGPNVGVYARLGGDAFYANALLKYQWLDAEARDIVSGLSGSTKGDGWGGWAEVGFDFGGPGATFGPFASIDYADFDMDAFTVQGTTVAFDAASGLRGKAGAKFSALVGSGSGNLTAYGHLAAVHEFKGRDGLALSNTGGAVTIAPNRRDTYGEGLLGLAVDMDSRTHGYIEGNIDFAGGVKGAGVQAGISFSF